ncbi:MAG: dihydrofolate reductase [Steroidobacteraceae bacterium]
MAARIALVVAIADNGVIGRAGGLPWHLPDDLKFFKSVTMGKPLLMGRRTFESIGRPLPGRLNLVVTRGGAVFPSGVEAVPSVEAALARAAGAAEICVIGGATLYAQMLAQAQLLYLTRVHAAVAGDVHFPPWSTSDWREARRVEHPADEHHAYAMSFLTLERIN